MNPLGVHSQVKLDVNKNIFNKTSVKSNYTRMRESFGQWLIRQRRLLGLTQTEFAERAQMKKATLSLYEKDGVNQPRFKQLDKIARALGKPRDEVRRAASPAISDESHDILDIATVMFHDADRLTPEEREELLQTVRRVAAGMLSEHGKK